MRINTQPRPLSCQEVTKEIASVFRARRVHDNPIEKWLFKNLDPEEFYPITIFYVEDSIFRDLYRFYIPAFGLAPNVRINGVNLGMDKLTHWSSTGRHYFSIFVTEKALGASDFEATLSAIHYGILDELTLHGYWARGEWKEVMFQLMSLYNENGELQTLTFQLKSQEESCKNLLKLEKNRPLGSI